MKITERLDIVADNMWNRGNWGPDLDTVKDAKEYIEKLENLLCKVIDITDYLQTSKNVIE